MEPQNLQNTNNNKQISIIFAINGKHFSQAFFNSWTECVAQISQNDQIKFGFINVYALFPPYSKNLSLGASLNGEKTQKPFNDEVEYDYIFWIDPYIGFNISQVLHLINRAEKENLDFISGIYLQNNAKSTQAIIHINENESTIDKMFHFEEYDSMKKIGEQSINGLVEVDSTGLGFALTSKKCFDSLEYPWFDTIIISNEKIKECIPDDISFCLKLKKLGIKIYVDPLVRVLREDTITY